MKLANVLILVFYTSSISFGQSYISKKGDKHLLGAMKAEDLLEAPYEKWYTENSSDYNPTLSSKDANQFSDINVKVFIGTWCGDTKFLVPKFIKTWEHMGLRKEQLSFVALHNEGDMYKQGPNKETEGYNIFRVPTFVFEKEGKEVGRIVERSVFSLEEDMLAIVSNHKYKQRYYGAQLMHEYLERTNIDSLPERNTLNEAFRKVRREVNMSSELNALGYVYKAQGKIEKALFVLKVNRYIYPYNPNIRDSYGEILMATGRFDEALKEYYEVIRLKGQDENASNMIAELYKKKKEEKSRKEG